MDLTDRDLINWLISLELGEYAPAFAENRIGPDVLPGLTDQDLRDLGIKALGDRKRLLAAIAALDGDGDDQPRERQAASGEAQQQDGERRQVTVLFADIADFTPLSERLGAEATHSVLNRYFEAADRIVEDFGGTVDKHIGDNVMAVFGAPKAHDNDPERAVRTALAIHEAAHGIELPDGGGLELHIGIASGSVVASGTGSDSHREYTVTGDAVNLAARLQGLAGSGETLVSDAVHTQTAGRFAAASLGPRELKGISRPVAVWRIDGTTAAAGGGRSTPFVGRRSELGQCRAIIEEVGSTGQGQTVLLRGPAGIGKTRLAEEAARIAQKADFAVHRVLVLDFGSRKGQGAVPALVRSLLGLSSDTARQVRAQAAESALAAGAFNEADRMFVNDLLDLPQPMELRLIYDAMDDKARKEGRQSLVVDLVVRASRKAPLLILVEDLHWADAPTQENLAAVMAATVDNPVALFATTRPEGDLLAGPWRAAGLDLPVSIINLGPLRTSEAREMAVGFARANEDRLAECLERAAGNPLFLEQLLQNVAESSAAGGVPGTIQSLVLARMDRLAPLDRRAIQAASIFGQRFAPKALRHLIEAPDYDPAGLLHHQLIRPEGEDFLFAHALIRDGIYESILTAARARLHLKAAEWFETTDPVLFAEHLELAGDPRAPRAYLDAARTEMARYYGERAIELLEKGRIMAGDTADRVELALALGEAEHNAGAPDKARIAFQEALEAAEDDNARCRALLGLAGVKRITDNLDGALADLDQAESAAERLGLGIEAARAHFLRGNVLFPRGDIEGCLREHGRALELAREAGSPELEAAALGGLADAEYMRGRIFSSCRRFTECVEVSRANGFGRIEVANLPMIAITALWCGESQRAMDTALRSIEAAQRVGHLRAEMIGHHSAFICCKPRGDFERARRHATKATALALKLGARRFEAESECFLAEIEFLQGDRRAALQRVRRSVEIIREFGMAYMGPMILGSLVQLTDDEAERRSACAEAEAFLARGAISHNHIFFRCAAIDTCLRLGDHDEAARHAQALRDYCPEQEIRLMLFFADRGLTLARAGRGERSSELAAEIDRLIADGANMQQEIALAELRRARETMAT